MTFADYYALAVFADGAVLLDLRVGTFFRLNRSAVQICEGLLHGQTTDAIAHDRAAALMIDPAAARREVEAVRAQLAAGPPPAAPNPIAFAEDAEGFILRWEGRPIWRLGRDGCLRYLADPQTADPDIQTQLLWVAPHLLRLRQRLVLHASAVARDGQVHAFCAGSGRGKTTLARRLAAHGMELIAEDLLILDLGADRPEVVRDGEPTLRCWAKERAATVRERGDSSLTAAARLDLARAYEGPRLPLGKIFFLERNAAESEIAEHPLGATDALLLLLENSFAELGRPDLWRQLWEENAKLAATVPMARVVVPEGLDRLAAAAGRYAAPLAGASG